MLRFQTTSPLLQVVLLSTTVITLCQLLLSPCSQCALSCTAKTFNCVLACFLLAFVVGGTVLLSCCVTLPTMVRKLMYGVLAVYLLRC
jgi:hypothetical protein